MKILKILLILFILITTLTTLSYSRKLNWDSPAPKENVEPIGYYVYHSNYEGSFEKISDDLPEIISSIKSIHLNDGYSVYQIPYYTTEMNIDNLEINSHYFVVTSIGRCYDTKTEIYSIKESENSNSASIIIPEILNMNKLNVKDENANTTIFIGTTYLGDSGRKVNISWPVVIDAKSYRGRVIHIQKKQIIELGELEVIKTIGKPLNESFASCDIRIPSTGTYIIQIQAGRHIGDISEEWTEWFSTNNSDHMQDSPVQFMGWPGKVGPIIFNMNR